MAKQVEGRDGKSIQMNSVKYRKYQSTLNRDSEGSTENYLIPECLKDDD
jgi:hypothetical protein